EPKLLPMFENEEELQFGLDLMQKTIDNRDTYSKMIDKYLRNWEADRVAYMDRIIMLTALTEILCFPNIALEISLNEYIEIAKEYSSEKSHLFINGILDNILKEQGDGKIL
ncbi:MAG: transcription antitermination factor NusB, partial [Paludibacteraceae bacterium]|nr:transcription antitermination factor NusB [Paludibacteraceae bacterium]